MMNHKGLHASIVVSIIQFSPGPFSLTLKLENEMQNTPSYIQVIS